MVKKDRQRSRKKEGEDVMKETYKIYPGEKRKKEEERSRARLGTLDVVVW